MKPNTYESIDETPLKGINSSKMEKKSFNIVGLLLATLALMTGGVMYHRSSNSAALSSSALVQFNESPDESPYVFDDELPTISPEEFKAEVDQLLAEDGLTLEEAAPIIKASIAEVPTLFARSNVQCSPPQINWNFGVGQIFVCARQNGLNWAARVFIQVAGITVFENSANLGVCGGGIDIPSFSIPPTGVRQQIRGRVNLIACNNNNPNTPRNPPRVEIQITTCT